MYINHLIKKQKIIEDTKKDYVPSYYLIITPPPNNLKNQQAYLTLGC
jgi:hypothetical protein